MLFRSERIADRRFLTLHLVIEGPFRQGTENPVPLCMPFFAAKPLRDEADHQSIERSSLDFSSRRYIGDKMLPADSSGRLPFQGFQAHGQKPSLAARFIQCVVEIPRFDQH